MGRTPRYSKLSHYPHHLQQVMGTPRNKTFVIPLKLCYEIDGINLEKDYGKDIPYGIFTPGASRNIESNLAITQRNNYNHRVGFHHGVHLRRVLFGHRSHSRLGSYVHPWNGSLNRYVVTKF